MHTLTRRYRLVTRTLLALGIAALLPTTRTANAGCGCDKPPPIAAPVQPRVTYGGMPVTITSPLFVAGQPYSVTFTSHAGESASVESVVTIGRNVTTGLPMAQLVVTLPALPPGPASIAVATPGAATPVIAIADAGFTVAAQPFAVPSEYGMWQFENTQAAVGRDGTVYLAVDVTDMTQPMVFEAEALGYPLRFGAGDVTFYNGQGYLMQALVGATAKPIPGMFVIPAVDMFEASDRLRYSRHEFATYFLDHAERHPHAVSADPNWHVDGTRHIDHDHLILAIRGKLKDGTSPVPGTTPAFDLVVSTFSLFNEGVVGTNKIKMENDARTDSYDPATGAIGNAGDLFTNGEVELKGKASVNGSVTARTFKVESGVRTGQRKQVGAPITFMDVELPSGTQNLGKIDLSSGIRTIVGPGSFRAELIKIKGTARVIVDNSAGPVTLYVKNEIELEGGIIQVADPRPEQFAIYVTGDKDVRLRGQTQLLSVLYAPYSKVVMENDGELRGSFVGREIEMKDRSKVHYDEGLRTDTSTAQ